MIQHTMRRWVFVSLLGGMFLVGFVMGSVSQRSAQCAGARYGRRPWLGAGTRHVHRRDATAYRRPPKISPPSKSAGRPWGWEIGTDAQARALRSQDPDLTLSRSPQPLSLGVLRQHPRSPCLSTAIRPYSRSHIYHPMHGHDAAARRPQA